MFCIILVDPNNQKGPAGERKLKRQRGYDGKNEVGRMDGEDLTLEMEGSQAKECGQPLRYWKRRKQMFL